MGILEFVADANKKDYFETEERLLVPLRWMAAESVTEVSLVILLTIADSWPPS